MNTEFNHQSTISSHLRNSKYTVKKRWTLPYTKSKWQHMRRYNELVEAAYIRLLAQVKSLYTARSELIYDHNTREDSHLNSTVMHTFLTTTLLLELECEYVNCKCQINYDFQQCPFEKQIKELFKRYPLSAYIKHTPIKEGVGNRYKGTLAFQGDTHFHHLT